MIINASRRTDIPAFYGDWFIKRLKEGYVIVPNPRNPGRYSYITLTPEVVDCIVFWTKNPKAFLKHLPTLKSMGYKFYFQYTLTPYDKNIERGIDDKENLITIFKQLSSMLGPEYVDWRYDPVFITLDYSVDYHKERFYHLCNTLAPFTTRCIISFINYYKNMQTVYPPLDQRQIHQIAKALSGIATPLNLPIYTCSESVDLSCYDIKHAACVDKSKLEEILGSNLKIKKDKNQREECNCVEGIDIGTYHSCPMGCSYCYATHKSYSIADRIKTHNPTSPFLLGFPTGEEIITNKKMYSQKDHQLSFF